MKKEKLMKVLLEEKEKYIKKSFEELSQIKESITYECGKGDNWYQVEVQLLENLDEYVHVSIAVDDGGFLRSLSPYTDSFIKYKNGKVEA